MTLIARDAPPLSQLALVRDRGGHLDRDEVVQRLKTGDFELRQQDVLDNYGFTADVLWFAFVIRNPSTRGSETMIEVRENNLNSVLVQIQRNFGQAELPWTVEQSGIIVPIAKRPVPLVPLIFNAAVPPSSDALVLVRIDNRGPNRLHIGLLPVGRQMAELQARALLLFISFGALIILVLYNVVLFLSIWEKTFLWFTIQLFFMGLYIFLASGYGAMIPWFDHAWFQTLGLRLFTSLVIVAMLQFQRLFLRTQLTMPRLDRVLFFHIVVAIGLSPLLFINFSLALLVGGVFMISVIGFMVAACIISIRRGSANALAVLIGQSFLMIGAILTELTTFGLAMPGWLLLIFSKADYIGIMMEALFFSLLLSARVRSLKSQRDAAEAKTRFRQMFIANVSHEMRTPLNAIIGFAEANEHSDDPIAWRSGNKMILKESEHLLFQINQVLDLAKLEAGRLPLELRSFSLTDSMNYLQSLWQERIRQRGLELEMRIEGDCPTLLLGDRLRIEQVLRNLVDNAIKFTEKGRILITLACARPANGVVAVRFTVSDTGIGIPEDKQAEIFDEFVQADSSITRRFGGTGLGTSIARRLVEVMGGKLVLHSRPGAGSSFTFGLGLEIADIPVAAQPAEIELPPPERLSPSGRRPRVLVVDDQVTNRQVVGVHLSRLAVEVVEAEDGEMALARMAEENFDLVLLDLYMPGMDGCQTARQIRLKRDPNELPILGLTASSDQADLDEAMAAGMNGILIKPIRRKQLLEHVVRLIPELQLPPSADTPTQ